MDDVPAWMKTTAGPLLAVPYPQEVNDTYHSILQGSRV